MNKMNEKIILFQNKEDCCGCSACDNVCPQGAIKMVPDELGFLYPTIDYERCVGCGLCQSACLYKMGYTTLHDSIDEVKAFALKHRDVECRRNSQSGGAFVALSDYVLQNNGVVYGVGFADDFTAVHKRAVTRQERDEFRGSKYIQSRMDKIYQSVKKDLDSNAIVMFVGTPCQVEGLKKYLGRHKNLDGLFLVDLICYSVASTRLWKEYLDFLCNKYSDSVINVNFRDKKFGWHSCVETINFSKHVKSFDYFARLFGSKISARDSCFNCKFTNLDRCSDITIGDYWGIERYIPDFEDANGVSIVFVNSKKGMWLFEKIKNCDFVEIPLEYALQPAVTVKQEKPVLRDAFLNDYRNCSIKMILKRYAGYTLKDKLKKCLKQFKIIRFILCKYKQI